MSNYNKPRHYAERPMEIELIRSMAHKPLTEKQTNKLNELLRSPAESKEAFIMKPAADWLQQPGSQQEADTLFGDFWYQGELCIMFADICLK